MSDSGGRFMVFTAALFIGSMLLVMAMRGTWKQVWAAVTDQSSASGTTGPGATPTAKTFTLPSGKEVRLDARGGFTS